MIIKARVKPNLLGPDYPARVVEVEYEGLNEAGSFEILINEGSRIGQKAELNDKLARIIARELDGAQI